jgi:ubiquinone/menaquinone biosynthesis C-methylase UbiE|tara:strand:- start:7 stop:423 length:417 start_codon:yes stop_codon:yes gene_type:complete
MIIKHILLSPLRIFFFKIFCPVYKRRLAEHVVSLCEDNFRILDFGCDDGTTAKMIMALNPSLKIAGVDIQSDRQSKIPRKTYDGKKLPFPDDSFDIVLAIDVLHHTGDILPLLEEMKRVSKKILLLKNKFIMVFSLNI